ncbi:hypothetical protein BH10PLA2_BH10PLA2_23780 [soil metagenome]
MTFANENNLTNHILGSLPREDLDIIVELVLKSGSLKDLATAYGVTYPTIRLRLDRVIERLQAAVNGKAPDPLKELLAKLVERGEISVSGARSIRDLVQEMAKDRTDANSTQKRGAT